MTHTSSSPKVSVVMTTYNRAHLLSDAIKSIVEQSVDDWELIIIDDASSDTTPEVMREWTARDSRIRYHRHPTNQGAATARNIGFQQAKGSYIALHDDDDLSEPRRLELQSQYLDSHPSIDMVSSWVHMFQKEEQKERLLYIKKSLFHYQKDKPQNIKSLIEMPFPFPCHMARKHVFQTVSMRSFFRYAEDYDTFLLCAQHFTLASLPAVLYRYRLGDESHATASTGSPDTPARCWQYHCLAWASAFHRRMGWQDPIDTAETIDDALHRLHPQFQTQARDCFDRLRLEFAHILSATPESKKKDILSFYEHFAGQKERAQLVALASNPLPSAQEDSADCSISHEPLLSQRPSNKAKSAFTPIVSVVIATYNRAHLLPHAIRSIINQTFTDWELIIIDDASSDMTEVVGRAFATIDPRIRYYRHMENMGLAVARNTSTQLALGEYIALQDDDDVSLPNRLQKQVDFLNDSADMDMVSSWMQCFDSNGVDRGIVQTKWISRAAHPPPLAERALHPMPSPCVMARRHVFIETPMRPFFRFCEDYDFLLRCIERYNISHIPEILYRYRLADTTHATLSTSNRNAINILKYHFVAWASACYRHKNKKDPVVATESNVHDLLIKNRRLFRSAPRKARKHLVRQYASHHFSAVWETQNPELINYTLRLLRRLLSYTDYINVIASHIAKDHVAIEPLFRHYNPFKMPFAQLRCFTRSLRRAIRRSKDTFCMWYLEKMKRHIPFVYRVLICPSIVLSCLVKKPDDKIIPSYDKIIPYLTMFLVPKRTLSRYTAPKPPARQKATDPHVSVVLPTHNRAHLLPDAMESIVHQTFGDWELIIIDDASTDSTPEIVREFMKQDPRIVYHRHTSKQGAALARNTATQMARGRYLALQDDDDVSLPHRLQAQVDFLNSSANIDLVRCSLNCFNERNMSTMMITANWQSRATNPPSLAARAIHPMPFPCIMARRHVFTETPMRSFFPCAEDYDFLLRCMERYNLSHIDDVLYDYRLADDTHTALTTNPSRSLNVLKYHFAAWASACYRDNNKKDPVETNTNVDDLLKQTRHLFRSASQEAKVLLIDTYAADHLNLTWHTHNPEAIETMLSFLKNLLAEADYHTLLDSHHGKLQGKLPEHLVQLYVAYRYTPSALLAMPDIEKAIGRAIDSHDDTLLRQSLIMAQYHHCAPAIANG
ncbi:MAG: glycosyltransferase [Alphaproteobacteria bacterium GM202ARS2]|nr:glycosyltransferase [Alphaproteobacteria bacterium GM202ARS2]